MALEGPVIMPHHVLLLLPSFCLTGHFFRSHPTGLVLVPKKTFWNL